MLEHSEQKRNVICSSFFSPPSWEVVDAGVAMVVLVRVEFGEQYGRLAGFECSRDDREIRRLVVVSVDAKLAQNRKRGPNFDGGVEHLTLSRKPSQSEDYIDPISGTLGSYGETSA
jgi:hypothetical protein